MHSELEAGTGGRRCSANGPWMGRNWLLNGGSEGSAIRGDRCLTWLPCECLTKLLARKCPWVGTGRAGEHTAQAKCSPELGFVELAGCWRPILVLFLGIAEASAQLQRPNVSKRQRQGSHPHGANAPHPSSIRASPAWDKAEVSHSQNSSRTRLCPLSQH